MYVYTADALDQAPGGVSTPATGFLHSQFRRFLIDVSSAQRASTSIGIKWLSRFLMISVPDLIVPREQKSNFRAL